jgi:hypothetical protein
VQFMRGAGQIFGPGHGLEDTQWVEWGSAAQSGGMRACQRYKK